MAISVQLDDQPFGAGREVGDIGIYGQLAYELHTDALATQNFPKGDFRRGLLRSQCFCAGAGFSVSLQDSPLSPTPLPLKGARGFRSTPLEPYASPRVSMSAAAIASVGDFPPHRTNWNTG